jgi:Flp pilus assembly protein TadG
MRGLRGRSAVSQDRGASAVEFALIVPILIVLVFGIIAFGIIFGQYLSLNNAAREAARFGVVRSLDGPTGRTCADVLARARESVGGVGMSATNVGVTVTVSGSAKCAVAAGAALSSATGSALNERPCRGSTLNADQLRVATTFRSTQVIPLLPLPTLNLQGDGVFRCEYSS